MSATLLSLASDLLDATVAALTLPPDRQYLAPGPPPQDCDSVAVWWRRADGFKTFPQAFSGRLDCWLMAQAELVVEVCRCVTVSDQPVAVATLREEANQQMTDASDLFFGLVRPDLFGGACDHVAFRGPEAVAPSGGLACVRMSVIVQFGEGGGS